VIALPMVDDVSCEGCGKCCEHVGSPPSMWPAYASPEWDGEFLKESEDYGIWVAMPQSLKDEISAYHNDENKVDRYELGLPCFWYDGTTKRCMHYEHRPSVCREFEKGSDECLAHRKGTEDTSQTN